LYFSGKFFPSAQPFPVSALDPQGLNENPAKVDFL
jgi:hypothetical protein